MPNNEKVVRLRVSPGPSLYGYDSASDLVNAVIQKNAYPEIIRKFAEAETVELVDIIPPASLPEAFLGMGVEVFTYGAERVLYVVGIMPPYSPVAPLHVFDVGLRVMPT